MAAASSPLPGQPGRGSRRARLGSRVTPRARRWPSAPLGPRGDGLRPAAALRRSCRLLRVPAGQQRDGAAQAGRWAPLWPTKPQLLALSVHAAPWLFFFDEEKKMREESMCGCLMYWKPKHVPSPTWKRLRCELTKPVSSLVATTSKALQAFVKHTADNKGSSIQTTKMTYRPTDVEDCGSRSHFYFFLLQVVA